MSILSQLGCFVLVVMTSWVWAADQAPGHQLVLDDAEGAWIKQHPQITVALDDANPPLNFRQSDGGYAGISVDYLRLIASKAGLSVQFSGSTWSDALTKAMNHQVDGIMSASYKEERRVALDFTEPYCETPEAMVTRKDFKNVEQLGDFAGQRVAVVAGSVRSALLRQQVPGVHIYHVENAGEGIKALSEGRVDALFDDLPVIQTQIDQMLTTQLRVALLYFQPEVGAQRIGVRNDAPLLRSILDKSILAITPDEHRAIRDRWLRLAAGAAIQHDLGLTDDERQWLSSHPVIRVGCDPDWAPIEWREKNGEWRGISVDYLQRLHQLLGVNFEIEHGENWQQVQELAKSGRIDMIACLTETAERRSSWLFSPMYASFPIAIFTRSEIGYLHGLSALENGSQVAVVGGYAEEELLRRDYPSLTLVAAHSTREGLEMVRRGLVRAYVGGLLTTAYSLQVDGDLSVHVAGETPYIYRQSLAVRQDWPVLHGILLKAMRAIPVDEREAIWRRWVSVNYQRGTDLSLIWKIAAVAFVLLAIFLYWNRRLSAEIRHRTKAESQLIAYRDRLEDLVLARTADLEAALTRLRRLAAAIEQTTEGVILASPAGRIDFVNPAFTRITGIDSKQAIGQHLKDIGLPWSTDITRSEPWNGQITGKRPDGSSFILQVVVTAVNDSTGMLVDLLTVVRDITTVRLTEERLAQSQKLEAVGTLAGGIAHDFNNILAAIMGATELGERAIDQPERRQRHFNTVITACERARTLVGQMLTFARGTAGDVQPLELAPIVSEALSLLRSSLPANIAITDHLQHGIRIMGDATRIHQIIMNLGTNAGLAMPMGGTITVELKAIVVDEEFAAVHQGVGLGPASHLTFRDTGVGMSPEVQARIFEPFFTTWTQGQAKGTGLGLAVVHGIIRDSGGGIFVTSEIGRGTTFTIILPQTQRAAAEAPTSAVLHTGNFEHILFVDDEPALCAICKEMLSELNYRVTIARDGQEALDLIQRDPNAFQLVITDTMMPRMTGLKLTALLRNQAPTLRVIICSGQGENISDDARQLGARFMAKPMLLQELSVVISESLGKAPLT